MEVCGLASHFLVPLALDLGGRTVTTAAHSPSVSGYG
jgi:hypothetical protein